MGMYEWRVDGDRLDVTEVSELSKTKKHDIQVVVDRIVIKGGVRRSSLLTPGRSGLFVWLKAMW